MAGSGRAQLAKEKAFTRLREETRAGTSRAALGEGREGLRLRGARGPRDAGRPVCRQGQLIVQHFMFGPDWNEGCPSCSFWSDNFNGVDVHLAHRDTSFVLVSRGPIDRLEAYRKRMGWSLRWVSSLEQRLQLRLRRVVPAGRKGAEVQSRDACAVRPGESRPQRLPPRRGRRDLSHLFDLCPRSRRAERRLSAARHDIEGPGRGRSCPSRWPGCAGTIATEEG